MDLVPLKSLGLEKRWPRLAELQNELAGLQRHQAQAEHLASTLHNQIPVAREQDLNESAAALRAGKEPGTERTHERAIEQRLENARRDSIIYKRAVEGVQADIGQLREENQQALFADVLASRAKIAKQMSEAASVAASGYAQYENLSRLVKTLAPAAPVAEIGPARSTTAVIGYQTTQRGPNRGDIEAALGYLVELGQVETDNDEQAGEGTLADEGAA